MSKQISKTYEVFTGPHYFEVPKLKWNLIAWWGKWDQLNQILDWCVKNKFLRRDLLHFRKKWILGNFHEGNNWPHEIEPFYLKLTWFGKLESLIEFFIIIEHAGFVDEDRIREWVADHFLYSFEGKVKVIKFTSLKVIWSRIAQGNNPKSKGLTDPQKNSLIELITRIKTP